MLQASFSNSGDVARESSHGLLFLHIRGSQPGLGGLAIALSIKLIDFLPFLS